MGEIAISSHFMQELRAGHALMMQCAASAERLLGRDRPAGSPRPVERAELEAARMAGLFARLAEGFGRGALLSGRLPTAAVDRAAEGAAAVGAAASPPAPKLHAAAGAARGRLKNGNPSGDYLKSPRCGACTRTGGCCRQPAMANGRCRMHGGLSTGPRTPEGLARCRTTRLVHGCRSRAHLALRSRAAHAARRLRALTSELSGRVPAGHGVHRSVSIVARHRAARRAAVKRAKAARLRALAGAIPAGHGVHRLDSINRKDMKLVLGPAKGRTRGMPSNPVTPSASSSAPSRLRVESTTRKTTLSAGHGLHRSFRDHLRSSACIGGFQTIQSDHQPSAGHGLHRSDSRGVTTPAGLR